MTSKLAKARLTTMAAPPKLDVRHRWGRIRVVYYLSLSPTIGIAAHYGFRSVITFGALTLRSTSDSTVALVGSGNVSFYANVFRGGLNVRFLSAGRKADCGKVAKLLLAGEPIQAMGATIALR